MSSVSRPEKTHAIFNLEATIIDDIFHTSLGIIQTSAIGGAAIELSARTTIQEERQALFDWFRGKTEEDVRPVMEEIAEQTSALFAPWALIAINGLARQGHEIAVVSGSVPDPIAEACADGIERYFEAQDDGAEQPLPEISLVMGRPIRQVDGRYTGEPLEARKNKNARKIVGGDWRRLVFAADSYNSGERMLVEAKKGFVVNPRTDFNPSTERRVNFLYWGTDEPTKVQVRNYRDGYSANYHLNDAASKAGFERDILP